jgi:hypothetical protein
MKSQKSSSVKMLAPAGMLVALLLAAYSCSTGDDGSGTPEPQPPVVAPPPPAPPRPPTTTPPTPPAPTPPGGVDNPTPVPPTPPGPTPTPPGPTPTPPGPTPPTPTPPPPMTTPPNPMPPNPMPPNPMPPNPMPPVASEFKPCDTEPAMTAPALRRADFATLPAGSQAGQVAGPPGEKGIVYALAHKNGNVFAIQDGRRVMEPFAKVTVGSQDREQGLLSIAFHPDFAKNQLFYLSYTAPNKGMRVDEFKRLTPTTSMPVRNVYSFDRNVGNNFHNGGSISFNPKDGPGKPWLYHSVGNWSGGDADSPSARLGRVLRYDVSTKMGVPGTAGGVSGFTFAYGLRNPYRMSIDALTGDMYIGEVANGKGGAIFFNEFGSEGANFGYGDDGAREINGGGRNISGGVDGSGDGMVGGVVYRGNKIPGLCGRYFYGLYRGGVKSLVRRNGQTVGRQTHGNLSIGGLSSFGVDGEGEIYMSNHDSDQIFKIEPM